MTGRGMSTNNWLLMLVSQWKGDHHHRYHHHHYEDCNDHDIGLPIINDLGNKYGIH